MIIYILFRNEYERQIQDALDKSSKDHILEIQQLDSKWQSEVENLKVEFAKGHEEAETKCSTLEKRYYLFYHFCVVFYA